MTERKPFEPAFLPTLNERRATLHTFHHSELITLQLDGTSVTGIAHFYRCTETGEQRRWGFDAGYLTKGN